MTPLVKKYPKWFSNRGSSGDFVAGLFPVYNFITNFEIDCGLLIDVLNRKVYQIDETRHVDIYKYAER